MLYKEDYLRALEIDQEKRLGHVVADLTMVIPRIWGEAKEKFSNRSRQEDWVNTHPIVLLYVDHLSMLAHRTEANGRYADSESELSREYDTNVINALHYCRDMIETAPAQVKGISS